MCPRTVRSHSIATCQEQAQAVVRAEAGTEAESCMSGQEIWTLSVFTGGGGGGNARSYEPAGFKFPRRESDRDGCEGLELSPEPFTGDSILFLSHRYIMGS